MRCPGLLQWVLVDFLQEMRCPIVYAQCASVNRADIVMAASETTYIVCMQ